jgi:hypothetical protein
MDWDNLGKLRLIPDTTPILELEGVRNVPAP